MKGATATPSGDAPRMAARAASSGHRLWRYHDRSKHHLHRLAPAPDDVDWSRAPTSPPTAPGVPVVALPPQPELPAVLYDDLLAGGRPQPAAPSAASVGSLLFCSLAVSGWKQGRDGRPRPLRVNPSSGNLHPTEAYLIAGPIAGLAAGPAIYRYLPHRHALEVRYRLDARRWRRQPPLRPGDLLLVLTSVHQRQSWKYGERGLRYSLLDFGHALGSSVLAAAALGWSSRLVRELDDRRLGDVLGLAASPATGSEWPGLALLLATSSRTCAPLPSPGSTLFARSDGAAPATGGLSASRPWPSVEAAAAAATRTTPWPADGDVPAPPGDEAPPRAAAAAVLARQRRSAIAFDPDAGMPRSDLYRILRRLDPRRGGRLWNALPWPPAIQLLLFVHRVAGLEPGLYFAPRDDHELAALRRHTGRDLLWSRPPGCPREAELWLLRRGDLRQAARVASCNQEIAASGAFSLCMLAPLRDSLDREGGAAYRCLHWEAGLLGQALYVEAEAAGLGATGIGCFFDDAFRTVLGLDDERLQDLYHFAVGLPLADPRLLREAPGGTVPGREDRRCSG